MAVAPDLLMSSASEVRPKAPPKSSAAPAEAANARSSSFARVLADERQADASSARQAENRMRLERAEAEKSQNSGAVEPSQEQQLADNGNLLPVEEEGETLLDPLLLLGLGGEPVADEPVGDMLLQGATVEVPIQLPVSLPVSVAGVIDPEVEQLNSAASVQVTLEMTQKAEAEKLGHSAGSLRAGTGDAALKALGDLNPLEVEPEVEVELEEFSLKLAEQVPDVLNESAGDTRLDNQAARLNNLAQAIHQASPAQRVLVPGQPVSMQQGGWSEAVVDRVMWLSSQNLRSAEIQLDPAELGRLDVRVTLNQDQALVSFSSPHAGVREALESQMYRMRELFAQQGMNQVDVNVSDQSMARNSEGRRDDGKAGRNTDGASPAFEGSELVSGGTHTAQPATLRGLVDYYA